VIITSAAGRCGIVGNPTDMYGGSVISCSTEERATTTLIPDTPDIVIAVCGQTQTLTSVADLAFRGDYLDVARAVLVALEVDPASTRTFHLTATTDIPMQAGLAGSTAILGTIVAGLLALFEFGLNPYQVAELIRKIESDVLQIVCGFQDHYMTVFGGLNYMDFRDKISSRTQDQDTPFATIEPLAAYASDIPIILAHTGVKHHSSTVHKSIRDHWVEGETAVVEGYLEIALLARLGKKAILDCDWDALAYTMNRNHAIQRDLGGSGDSNERLIAAALSGGAFAAKLAGGTAAGTIIALTLDPVRTEKALLEAGADKILLPRPTPGLTVEVRL